MIYRCFTCRKVKAKKTDTYQIQIRNNLGVALTKYICDPCGDNINANYEAGKKVADNEQLDE